MRTNPPALVRTRGAPVGTSGPSPTARLMASLPPSGTRLAFRIFAWYMLIIVRPKSLVLFGPTRTGKTVWARSLGRHLYFCGLYSYKEANKADEAQYAVFDDIQGGIKFFPSFKNWLGGQEEFQIKGLYRDPEIIKWGKPSVWISNTDPRHDMSLADVEWMEGNCTFVEVRHPMFRASSM